MSLIVLAPFNSNWTLAIQVFYLQQWTASMQQSCITCPCSQCSYIFLFCLIPEEDPCLAKLAICPSFCRLRNVSKHCQVLYLNLIHSFPYLIFSLPCVLDEKWKYLKVEQLFGDFHFPSHVVQSRGNVKGKRTSQKFVCQLHVLMTRQCISNKTPCTVDKTLSSGNPFEIKEQLRAKTNWGILNKAERIPIWGMDIHSTLLIILYLNEAPLLLKDIKLPPRTLLTPLCTF